MARALAEKVGGHGAAEFFAERGKGGDVERAVAFPEGRVGGRFGALKGLFQFSLTT